MLIYDYVCKECGLVDEWIVTEHDDNIVCPVCGCSMKRQFPTPSFKVNGDSSANNYGLMDTHEYIKQEEKKAGGNVNSQDGLA